VSKHRRKPGGKSVRHPGHGKNLFGGSLSQLVRCRLQLSVEL
jgi:hypothetical protein